jgi:hypothetical protein
MHSGIFKLFTNSEYRDRLFSDSDYWLILIGLSYFILLGIHRDLFIKQKSFRWLLIIAVGFSIIANALHYEILEKNTAILILNGPIICLLVYRLAYEAYLKLFKKPPLSPLNMIYNFNEGLVKDRVFNFVVFLIIAFTYGLLIMIK